MRLRPVSADELEPWVRPWGASEPRFRPTTDARLIALRHSVFEDALAAIKPGRPVKVATYVFADRGVDADALHDRLAEHARDRGWTVHRERFTDQPPTLGQPNARPQFNLACRHAASGFVDGVLATSRGAMPSTEAYESYLNWLHRHHAFIAFLQPTIGGATWTDR
ncbi:hypothetical protein ABT187_38755 [Streptomyces sp. NPDC001817]|uniref:hypothetical protein n=1 Tax=Streptomyces sp. NPDC001817 TaxID=3154398 RepID=UPI00331D7A01